LGLLPIIPYNLHLFYNNQREHFFAYDYKTNILKHLKPNAILFTEDDNIGFTLWYLCYCEKERQDIDLVSTIFIQYDWYAEQIKHLHPDYPKPLPQAISGEIITRIKLNNIIHNNINSRPIYVFSDRWVDKKYGLVPEGMCWRAVDRQVNNKILYEELEKNKIEFKIRGLDKSIYKDWRTQAIINNYANSYSTYGGIYGNIGKYDKAIIELQKAIKLDPKSSNAHYNLGIAYKMIGKTNEAIKEFKKAIELDPNNISARQALQAIYQ
jgi:tetratricopeptide (TPR) repeat protein